MESDAASSVSSHSPTISDINEPPPSEVFVITKKDAEILSEYVDEFQDGNAEIRSKIIANAMAAMVMLRPPGEPFEKGEVSKKVRKWFYNRYNQPERQYVKFIRKYSARNTFYHMCRDEVMTEAEEMSGAPPGSQAFLGSLQDATTKLWKNLPDSEQQLYVRLSKKWSNEAPPPHIQARMADSVSAKIVRDFQTQLFKICGIRCIVLTAHGHENKQVITGMFETTKVNDTEQSFGSFCPNWRTVPLFKEWQKYAKKCYKTGDVQTVPKSRLMTDAAPVPIHVKSDGYPEIPNITKKDKKKTKTMQAMLREYCTAHIRYVTGNECARIPWTQLCQNPSDWIKSECMPDGFKWADPSKLRIGDIFLLLEHWRERQRQRLTPLIWVTLGPLFRDTSLSAEERQEYHSDQSLSNSSTDDVQAEERPNTPDSHRWSNRLSNSHPNSSEHDSGNSGAIFGERSNPQSDGIHSSDYSAGNEWGGINEDSHMRSPPPHRTYSRREGVGSPQYNITPTESHRGSDSDRGGPSAGPQVQYNRPEDHQNPAGDFFKISDLPKRTVKLTEKAKNVDTARGTERLTNRFFERQI